MSLHDCVDVKLRTNGVLPNKSHTFVKESYNVVQQLSFRKQAFRQELTKFTVKL